MFKVREKIESLGLTEEEKCHYCGAELRGYNLDRKDNTKGYSKENCVVCCGQGGEESIPRDFGVRSPW